MIRAAAKNHDVVAVVTEPADYAAVLAEMAAHDGATSLALRSELPARPLRARPPTTPRSPLVRRRATARRFPQTPDLRRQAARPLRYGENPHQQAAFYLTGDSRARRRHSDAAAGQGAHLQQHQRHRRRLRTGRRVRPQPACRDHQARQSLRRRDRRDAASRPMRKALACDPVSAFGGIVALNRPLDAATARGDRRRSSPRSMIAPDADDEAQRDLRRKKNLRLLIAGGAARSDGAGHDLALGRRRLPGAGRATTARVDATPTSRW